MRQARKVLTVPPNGQISIGKQWAGREVMIRVEDPNRIVITSGTFVPADQATFYTAESRSQLAGFTEWSERKSAKKTNVKQLRRRVDRKG